MKQFPFIVNLFILATINFWRRLHCMIWLPLSSFAHFFSLRESCLKLSPYHASDHKSILLFQGGGVGVGVFLFFLVAKAFAGIKSNDKSDMISKHMTQIEHREITVISGYLQATAIRKELFKKMTLEQRWYLDMSGGTLAPQNYLVIPTNWCIFYIETGLFPAVLTL